MGCKTGKEQLGKREGPQKSISKKPTCCKQRLGASGISRVGEERKKHCLETAKKAIIFSRHESPEDQKRESKGGETKGKKKGGVPQKKCGFAVNKGDSGLKNRLVEERHAVYQE